MAVTGALATGNIVYSSIYGFLWPGHAPGYGGHVVCGWIVTISMRDKIKKAVPFIFFYGRFIDPPRIEFKYTVY